MQKRYSNNTKPYIYVAYSENDKELSSSILNELSNDGIEIWFSDSFDRKEKRRLEGAFGVLLIASDEFTKSKRFHEIVDEAVYLNKNILCVYLDRVEMTPWLNMQLGSQLALFRDNYENDDLLTARIKQAQIFQNMSVTDAQKRFQRNRGIAFIVIPVIAAATLFATTVFPLLTKTTSEKPSIIEKAGLSASDLESIEELNIVGDEVFTTFVHAWYADESRREVYYNIETGNGQECRGPIPVGTLTTEDLEILKSMPNLKFLTIEGQEILDLNPIYELEQIEILRLNCNPISDINGIEKMQNLREISLVNTNVSDISPLYQIPTLDGMQLEFTYVNDVSGAGNMPNLRQLHIGGTFVTELPELNVKSDVAFTINDVKIKDYSSLGKYDSFAYLDLSSIYYEKVLKYIKGTPIEKLNWNDNAATSIKQLEGIQTASLTSLNLEGISLLSLDGIEMFNAVSELSLRRQVNIQDFSPLLNMNALKRVILPKELKNMAEIQLKDADFEIEYD